MAILVADNFHYQGRKPLDSRIIVDTISDMVNMAESIIYEGILVYNKETKKFYQFDPMNTVDTTLGKWRELSSAASGNTQIVDYAQDASYIDNSLIVYNNQLYLAITNFTSDNTTGNDIDQSFAVDVAAGNIIAVSAESAKALLEYQKSTDYKKDMLIYRGDRIGRAAANFTSDNSELLIEDSFKRDIENGNIIVDKIDITELDEQLLKALPIVAFVTKHDIPRFESNMTISGSIPKFRDGTSLSTEEKIGCNFLYIVDANNELIGLAMVMNYDETVDEFTVNAMKYGVGATDNILPSKGVLTKRSVGDYDDYFKDDILHPVLTIKDTAPLDTNIPWYQSNILDATGITPGSINAVRYNNTTSAWDINETIPLKESDIVKNENGAEWEYFRLYTNGNVFVSLSKYQLVYDTNQILGKITNINAVNHKLTITTIHANPETDAVLEEDVQANTAIGAAPANFKYPKDMTFTEFVKTIAIREILANLNFSITDSGLHKKGTTINGCTLTATLTNLGNVPIENIKFYLGNTELATQVYTDGTTVYVETYTTPISTNTTFAATVEHKGDKRVRKEQKMTFVNPIYIGAVNTLIPSTTEITAFPELLRESYKGSYTVTMNDQRTCIAYPASMGNISSIKDTNNFEYINSFTKTTDTINGETYNIYVLTDAVTAQNFKWTFN